MRILGLSCDYHDAAGALIIDGEVVAAAEEERFTRVKHDDRLPEHAIASILATSGVAADDLDVVVFHEKPLAVVSRVLSSRQRSGLRGLTAFSREMPVLLRRNLLIAYRVERMLRRMGARKPPSLRFSEHHLSHAAAAYLPSPFSNAAILTVDGIGEWATAAIGHGVQHRVELLTEQRYPNSLGLLYTLFTEWCGFDANDGEYKLMGLAPFGEPRFADALAELVHLDDDGSIEVDVEALRWWSGPGSLRHLFERFGGPPLPNGAPPTRRECDLARTVQEFVEQAMLRMAEHAHALTGSPNLCIAGGVGLNCVANGRILRDGPFDELWVQPAAGDAGSAIGAALWYWHDQCDHPRSPPQPRGDGAPGDGMHHAQLGPAFDPDEIEGWLREQRVEFERVPKLDERCAQVAAAIEAGAVVGWFAGRMEFGPRALGHRSILADPRSPDIQRDINLRVKGRESFRPFAPAVMWEHANEWFDIDRPSPFMLRTVPVAERRLVPVDREPEDIFERVQVVRSSIPACTHVDGSARVQTVHRDADPDFWALLDAFRQRTGCPVLLNTSFNRAGEPIVCSPQDALDSARAAGLDLLVLEQYIVDLRQR